MECPLESGGDLLFRAVSSQVPSALKGLTSVFGMGTGGTPSPLPPETVAFLMGLEVGLLRLAPLAHLVLPKVPYCSSVRMALLSPAMSAAPAFLAGSAFGKSLSSRNEPSPSGSLSFLPSGLLALPAALPAHQV